MNELRKKIADLLISDLSLTEKLACAAASFRVADWLVENGVTIPVRCKECKHYTEGHCLRRLGGGSYVPFPMDSDDFCSYGER